MLLMNTYTFTSSYIVFQLLTFHIRNAIIQANFMHTHILYFLFHLINLRRRAFTLYKHINLKRCYFPYNNQFDIDLT
jgi:hypothetical protein